MGAIWTVQTTTDQQGIGKVGQLSFSEGRLFVAPRIAIL
jgi:hypothetical protein